MDGESDKSEDIFVVSDDEDEKTETNKMDTSALVPDSDDSVELDPHRRLSEYRISTTRQDNSDV